MKKIIFFIFCMLCPFFLTAHPHIWIDTEFEVVFDKTDLKGMYITWTFDKFFSSDIISGYDIDHDGEFNESETTAVFQNAFIYTGNYQYFTFIRSGKIRKSPIAIERSQFSAAQKDGVLSYTFYVDLSEYENIGELYIACYDYTFFCDFEYKKDAVHFTGASGSPEYTIVENKDYPIYYDPFGLIDDTRVYSEWAQGLNTYYPREIKLTF